MLAIRRLFVNFRKVDISEISFIWLPLQPANEQVLLLIFAHFGLRQPAF